MTSDLPYFIQNHLAFINDIYLSRRHRSTVTLLKNLQLYELRDKHIVNSIDLKNTILSKIHHRIESASPISDVIQIQENDVLGTSIRCSNPSVGEIVLGKYVYQNRNLKAVYIILKCWNSLVIVKKGQEGLILEKEYEDVETFEIIKGRKHDSKLSISFKDSSQNLVTCLQEKSPIQIIQNTHNNKKLEDAIRMKQSELLVHKTITKKDFATLKSSSVFGSNFLRTHHVDEMRILSKCSDAWLKINANDKIVVGVPLVNNSCSRLTTLRNLRGVLQCSGSIDLSYTFTMYEQCNALVSMENIKCAFDSENSQSYDWRLCEEMSLRPETIYVFVFETNMKQLIEYNTSVLLLFVSYDIILNGNTFRQRCFIGKISFRDVFTSDSHKINFHPNQLHRDLLSVISTSHKQEIYLNFSQTYDDLKKYLCNEMNFFAVCLPETPSETMQVDGCDEENEINAQPEFFYNNNPNSLWHGTFIVITEVCDKCYLAKLFTKTREKAIVFHRYLEIELRHKCGIYEISTSHRSLDKQTLIQFECLLRDECKLRLELLSMQNSQCVERVQVQELHEQIHLMELKTDLCLRKLNS